jgi:outer membrane protein assembly factor BamE (lipoprotein component of BamABCDE complex)
VIFFSSHKKNKSGQKTGALASIAIASVLISACAADVNVRGNIIDPDQSKIIKPGVQNKAAVRNLLGSPTNVSTFSNDTWYYITQLDHARAFRENTSLSRNIFAVSFDKTGIVTKIKTYTLKDGRKVRYAKRVTPTPGREFTLIQQLMGNLGRFETKDNE